MSLFGWSYPPGCSGGPYDNDLGPHPLSEEICALLEQLGCDQERIDYICQEVEKLATLARAVCPVCEARALESYMENPTLESDS